MKRLLPLIVLGPLFLSGAALAQSSGFSGIPGFEVPQIDPPSIDIDVGAATDSDPDLISDLAEAQEVIAGGISEALVTTAGGIAESGDDAQPANIDLQNVPQKQQRGVQALKNLSEINESDPGIAFLESLAGVEEVVRKGMTKPDLIEGIVDEAVEETLANGRKTVRPADI